MFTPLNIMVALEGIFDLYEPDTMVEVLENYSEEFDDISSEFLAKAFQRSAETIPEYRVWSSFGNGFCHESAVLFTNRAVKILHEAMDFAEDEQVCTIQKKELWLQEDMTFCVVQCVSTFMEVNEEKICLCEYRKLISTVESEKDIFFDIAKLICELDDICMFESLLAEEMTVCES